MSKGKVDRLVALLTDSRSELLEAVESVPGRLRDVPPGDSRWCVAEILEHCAIVEREVDRLLTDMAERAGAAPVVYVEEEDPRGRIDLLPLLDRSQRYQAAEPMRPSGTLHWLEALHDLNATRISLLRTIASVRHRPLERASAPHFLIGELNGYEWLEFVGRHEQRHADQLREAGRHLRLAGSAQP